jgi:hypothetical protein
MTLSELIQPALVVGESVLDTRRWQGLFVAL